MSFAVLYLSAKLQHKHKARPFQSNETPQLENNRGGDASILNGLEGWSAYISQCWRLIAESQSKSDRSTTLCPITFRAQETLHSNSWAMPYLKTTIMYSFGRISPKPSTHNSPQACRQDKKIGHCVHATCFSTINKLLQTHSAALTTRL